MKIAIVGKSCSGKDRLASLLQDHGFKKAVFHTSRPPRHYEADGVHYKFLDEGRFRNMIDSNEMIECRSFNDWHYGLSYEEYQNSEVLIITPSGFRDILKKESRDNLLVVYVDTNSRERIKRSVNRGDDSAEILRRYLADEEDFQDFKDWDYRITFEEDPSYNKFLKFFTKIYAPSRNSLA
jgi:guanylate kinase